MISFFRHRFLECIVVASTIATLSALALPEGALDTNPDNTVPIASILPKYDRNSNSDALQIVLMSAKPQPSGDKRLTFVLLNTGNSPAYYTGYAPYSFSPRLSNGHISPLYKKQMKIGTSWQDKELRWCGNGVKSMRLPPGHAAQFTVWQKANESTIQIGVPFHTNTNNVVSERDIVWSAIVDVK